MLGHTIIRRARAGTTNHHNPSVRLPSRTERANPPNPPATSALPRPTSRPDHPVLSRGPSHTLPERIMFGDDMGTKLGRLTYRTPAEARAAAADLGLDDIHSHQAHGELVWMPGANHSDLNDALRKQGRMPVSKPGSGGPTIPGVGEVDENGGLF